MPANEKEKKMSGYTKFKKDAVSGNIGNAYIFYGEEKYLLEYYTEYLRKKLLPEGMWEFNHKRFNSRNFTISAFDEAVNALPVMSERTLIELNDVKIFDEKEDVRESFLKVLEDIPEYVCIIMIFDTLENKADKRLKFNSQIMKKFESVEFEIQNQTDLLSGIRRRYKEYGKEIDTQTAEYLIFVTGGLMNRIITEIGKTAAYSKGPTITRNDIDAVVVPILDAAAYKLTDALIQRKFNDAAQVLNTLLDMQEAPHRIIFGISMKYRQLLAAKVCLDNKKTARDLGELCGIRYDFQSRGLMQSAGRLSVSRCCQYVRLCTETAYRLNNGGGKEELIQLLINIAYADRLAEIG